MKVCQRLEDNFHIIAKFLCLNDCLKFLWSDTVGISIDLFPLLKFNAIDGIVFVIKLIFLNDSVCEEGFRE